MKKLAILILLSCLCMHPTATAAAAANFQINADTPWIVPENQPEAVERALENVKRDWYKVFGHLPVVAAEAKKHWRGPILRLGIQGASDNPESFVLKVERDADGRTNLVATGGDIRGAIYAAYTLSEEILGVDPWYFWTDQEPTRRKQIEVSGGLDKKFGSPTFRYRGWFINDEDLLNSFSRDALRENAFSPEMFDRVCETLLRTRGNMICAGTYNLPDERFWELASRRGLVINHHHHNPLGLSTWRYPKDVPFSFTKHPEVMEKYWRQCAKVQKGREIVWNIGYRGKDDRAFWTEEPEFDTPEKRGAVITSALAKQAEIIREVDPSGMIMINLWGEGSALYHEGHLKLPEGVVLVWADEGSGIPLDKDKKTGAYMVKEGQGLYIHTAMLSGWHNQMSELVPPERIYREVGRFVQAKATNFLLINTSDLRPVPLSTDCLMRFAWNAGQYAGKTAKENGLAFYRDWSRRQFGETALADEVAAVYQSYFDLPFLRDKVRRGENWWFRLLNTRDLQGAAIMAKPQSEATVAAAKEAKEVADLYLADATRHADEAQKLLDRIPANRKDFYIAHILSQARLHQHFLSVLKHYSAGVIAEGAANRAEALTQLEQALNSMEEVYASLQLTETAKWAGWYEGNCLVPIAMTRDQIRSVVATLKGEPSPPTRQIIRLEGMWKYQEPFLENYPFIYPSTQKERGGSH